MPDGNRASERPGATLFGVPSLSDEDEAGFMIERSEVLPHAQTPVQDSISTRPRLSSMGGLDSGPPSIELESFEGLSGIGASAEEVDEIDLSIPIELSDLGDLGDDDLPTTIAKPSAGSSTSAGRFADAHAAQQSVGRASPAAPPEMNLPPVPAPPPAFGTAHTNDFDLEPDEIDLPAPIDGLDLPAPVAGGNRDLPMPIENRQTQPAAPKQRTAAQASIAAALAELDLPAPVDDLPAPRGASSKPVYALDLDEMLDLPAPSEADLPGPRNDELEPLPDFLAPVDLDVAPVQRSQQSRKQAPASVSVAPASSPITSSEIAMPGPQIAASIKHSHVAAPSKRANKRVLLLGTAVMTLAALGAGLYAAGMLDAPDDAASSPRAERGSKVVPDAGGPAKPRSEAVLAQLRQDTPAGYREAQETAAREGDNVGAAEAALLMHLRYGPDPVQVGRATQLLAPYENEQAPHTRRVFALLALARGQGKAASEVDVGDDVQGQLYAGMAALATGDAATAGIKAKAVRAADPGNTAALVLEAEAVYASSGDRTALEGAVKEQPAHAGIRLAAARAALSSGYLRAADAHLGAVADDQQTSAEHRAHLQWFRAEIARQRGDLVAARAHLDKANSYGPKLPEVHRSGVQLHLARGDLFEAGKAADAWSLEHPEDHESKLQLADVRLQAGDGDQTLALLEALKTPLAGRPELATLRGKVHAMRMQMEEATAAFDEARAAAPMAIEADVAHARMLITARRQREAMNVLDRAAKRLGDENNPRTLAELFTARGHFLLEAGERDAADAAFVQALKHAPDHNEAQLHHGLLAIERGSVVTGRADLLAVYDRTGGYPGLTAPLARVFAREGKMNALAELIGDTTDLSEASSEIKLAAARLHLTRGDLEAARPLVDAALAVDPNDWEAHLLTAQISVLAGDYPAALASIDRAKPRSPQAEVHLQRGKILEYNARHNEAQPEYQRALALDPELHEARFLYGRLLAFEGSVASAAAELQRVVSATDAFPEAWFYLGRSQRELSKFDAALKSFERAVALDPKLYEAHYYAGRMLFDQNKHAAAAESLQHAVEGNSSDALWYPDAWMFLGRARAQAGHAREAKIALERFLLIAPQTHPSRREAERQLRDLG